MWAMVLILEGWPLHALGLGIYSHSVHSLLVSFFKERGEPCKTISDALALINY